MSSNEREIERDSKWEEVKRKGTWFKREHDVLIIQFYCWKDTKPDYVV